MPPTPIADGAGYRPLQIAFHTPLNLFDDGRISGDRLMARQIAAALAALGHRVEPVSQARSYLREPAPALLDERLAEARQRLAELEAQWRAGAARPQLWFTYHSYYKAPDLLGPQVARLLKIPYVVAEASDSEGRAAGPWARHVAIARAGFAAADLHLCFTERDRQGIAPHLGPKARLLAFPPFILEAGPMRRAAPPDTPPRLICVAMMRPGAKLDSYQALGRVLAGALRHEWSLTIIGDGPEREAVKRAFQAIPPARIDWRGALPHEAVAEALAQHDLFIWPGLGEAYGLVYLEAQAAGLPVMAFASGGVPETLLPGETGLLAPERDEKALAAALDRLLGDPALRARMGQAAADHVRSARMRDSACRILAEGFAMIGAGREGGPA